MGVCSLDGQHEDEDPGGSYARQLSAAPLRFLLPCSAVANQLATSFILELLVHPVLYAIWKWRFVMRGGAVIPGPAELGHAA